MYYIYIGSCLLHIFISYVFAYYHPPKKHFMGDSGIRSGRPSVRCWPASIYDFRIVTTILASTTLERYELCPLCFFAKILRKILLAYILWNRLICINLETKMIFPYNWIKILAAQPTAKTVRWALLQALQVLVPWPKTMYTLLQLLFCEI